MYNPLLLTFIYVVETGSFSKAAKELYITPASVMKQMNALENQLDIKLIERTHRGIQLTKNGEKIYQKTKELIEDSEKFLNNIKDKNTDIIRIGSSFLNSANELVDLWHNIPSLYENYRLRVVPYEDDHVHIMEVFQSIGTKFDFLIGSFNSKQIDIFTSYKILGFYNLCVAVPKTHSLAKKKRLEITDLYHERLLCVSGGDCLNIDDFRKDVQTLYPQIILEDVGYFYDLDTFNRCEEQGCLLLTLDVWNHIHPSLIILPVSWHYQMPYGLLYQKNPSKQVKACLKEIEKYYKDR